MKRKKSRTSFEPLLNHRSSPSTKKIVIKKYDETPNPYRSKIDPVNLEEQKTQFLRHGQTPHFQFKVAADKIEELSHSKRAEIEFDLMDDALRILEKVRHLYGPGNACVEETYGSSISVEAATKSLTHYLQQNGVDAQITIGWTKDLACSAKMAWCGPNARANKPEARKYSLFLKDSTENHFLRERGIICLANHEIGTHFFRSVNDGLQPWYSNREQFGLKKMRSHQLLETEEGLATINTLIQAKTKLLWIPALIYYTSCKAATMTFEELFSHLGQYLDDRELRWRYVMRVKRSLPDPAGVGGYGNDQCYFKGAAEILRHLDTIDFRLLFAGKICLESLSRVQRTARLECVRFPQFMQNFALYMKTVRSIASANGFSGPSPRPSLSSRVARGSSKHRLKKGRAGGKGAGRKGGAAKKPVQPDAESAASGDEEEPVGARSVNAARDRKQEEEVLFRRTLTQPGASLSPSQSAERDGPKDCSAKRYLSKSFLHASTASLADSGRPVSDRPTPDNRSRSQLAVWTPEDSQLAKKSSSHNAPASSKMDPSHCASVSPNSKYKRGVAERPVSPLLAGVPTFSARYSREKCNSPVPFSPHRWLLWRREKCPRNTFK